MLLTVPLQLQFTYVALAATVVIRDIKNPWKRFGIYAIVILAGRYARVRVCQLYAAEAKLILTSQSWSTCHWTGLALADLEATYQWRKRLLRHHRSSYHKRQRSYLIQRL